MVERDPLAHRERYNIRDFEARNTARDTFVIVRFNDGSETRVRSRRYAPTDELVATFTAACERHIAERYARDMTPRG